MRFHVTERNLNYVLQNINKTNKSACHCIWTLVQVDFFNFILRESFFLILQQMVDADCFVSRHSKQIVRRIAVTQIVAFVFVFH